MASKKEKLRVRLQQQLETAKPALIDETLAAALRASLEPVSAAMFRALLRECGLPLAPLVEGVRQDDLHQLERTLLAMAQGYWQAAERHDRTAQRRYREAVIRAKDHARLASLNPNASAQTRAAKEEMLLWMLTWLENPAVFELWLGLRKTFLTAGPPSPL